MVTFGTITDKTLRVQYTKEDYAGFKVAGNATYNKENKLVDANGTIKDEENVYVADFNVYGMGENARVNLTNCLPAKMEDAIAVAQATLADLASQYPEE